MPDTFTLIKNRTEPRLGQLERTLDTEGSARPAWVIGILASVLIFTTVVDVLGNLLVIISVFRNRKLRNSGKIFSCNESENNQRWSYFEGKVVTHSLLLCTYNFNYGSVDVGCVWNRFCVNRLCFLWHFFLSAACAHYMFWPIDLWAHFAPKSHHWTRIIECSTCCTAMLSTPIHKTVQLLLFSHIVHILYFYFISYPTFSIHASWIVSTFFFLIFFYLLCLLSTRTPKEVSCVKAFLATNLNLNYLMHFISL